MTDLDDSMVSVRHLVDDVAAAFDFSTTHLTGPGRRQIVLDDPSSNPDELFTSAGAK